MESSRHVALEELPKYRNINVNYDINLKNPVIVKPPAGPDKVLRVEFSLTINYLNPSIGYIRFEGFCDYAGEGPETIRSEWEAGRASPDIQNEVANNMVARVVPHAMLIAQSLSLPPAVPLPMINFQKTTEEQSRQDKFDLYHA